MEPKNSPGMEPEKKINQSTKRGYIVFTEKERREEAVAENL